MGTALLEMEKKFNLMREVLDSEVPTPKPRTFKTPAAVPKTRTYHPRCDTGMLPWPRRLSWMRRPTGDQEVAGSTPAEVDNILSWRLILKYFLRSFSPFRWFKKDSCQFLAKECAQYWLTA